MALKLCCDGCGTDLDQADAHPHGQLARVFYCAGCESAFTTATEAIDAERVRLVEDFEAFRKKRLAALRETVKALPDE